MEQKLSITNQNTPLMYSSCFNDLTLTRQPSKGAFLFRLEVTYNVQKINGFNSNSDILFIHNGLKAAKV